MHVQHEHAARDRKILHKVDHLSLVSKVEVEQQRADNAEGRERQRSPARQETGDQRNGATDLERNNKW